MRSFVASWFGRAGQVVLLIILVAAPGCERENRRVVNEVGLTKVTVAQAGDFFLYAPLYVAKDARLFEKNGLDVNIVGTGGDEKTWAAVTSGSAAFGIADPTFAAVSGERGQPGRVIASLVNGVPFWGITLDQDIPEGVDAIRNHSVATFPSPSTAYTLQRKLYEDRGWSPRIREGAFGTLMAMLRSDRADIALELEPNVSQAVSQGARVIYSMPDLYGDFAITGVTTTAKLLETKPELANRFLCSLQEALDLIRADEARALEILQSRFPEIKSEVAQMALRRVVEQGIIPQDLVVSEEGWASAVKLRLDAGDLQRTAEYAEYVEQRFAIAAADSCSRRKVSDEE